LISPTNCALYFRTFICKLCSIRTDIPTQYDNMTYLSNTWDVHHFNIALW
jgi:hypothetical protein